METREVFLRDISSHTGIGLSGSRWVERLFDWPSEREAATQTTTGWFAIPELVSFERAFKVRNYPTLRLTYLSRADRLADSMTRAISDSTAPSLEDASRTGPIPDAVAVSDIASVIDEIIDWLDATYEEIARITNTGRSTLFHWRKPGNIPRSASTRKIYRLHSIASLLIKRFGRQGARTWLQSGVPRPWESLLAGDLEGVEERIRSELFGQNTPNRSTDRALPDDVDWSPLSAQGQRQVSRARRSPKRGRPGKS